GLDLITLDLPEPWRVLKHAEESLKNGCYLITYLPTIVQVQTLVEEAKKFSFFHEKTLETMEREWIVDGRKVRPKNLMVAHTAFITFLRKA
ncbi:tRNA (adenine-N1)-methyltransferase, partial [Candidatus Woesearchaeota archaeon]|nr:tRNA (adenine-N1)-methyltransferase [Candidatus Woesearchaeota archaeon]